MQRQKSFRVMLLNRMNPYYIGLLFLFCCNVSIAQTPLKVACIGNSVTYGMTHKNPVATSYPSQLQQMLGNGYMVKNFGHSGATLLRKGHNPYNKTTAFTDALAFAPDIAIIHLGLNDTDPRNWPNYRDDFAPDYAWLIDTLRKVNANMRILICRLSPIFNGHPRFLSGTRDWYWQIQQLIPQIAKANHTGLIDFHAPLYSRPELLPDNLHPNEEGATLLAKAAYQKLSGDYDGLKLAAVFASHMVLQRNKPIQFYGTANANAMVTVLFNGIERKSATDDDGNWKISFPSMKSGGPLTATILSGEQKIVLDDILIGEVWLCAGQSNMYFQLQQSALAQGEMQAAQKNDSLRLLKMQPIAETNDYAWDSTVLDKVNKLQYFTGQWQVCDSVNAKTFSAVAYYFALKLQQQLKVPVGLIQVAVGGSDTESWIDRYTMEHHPVLVNELMNWRKSNFYMPWVRERADTNLKQATNPKQRHPYEPVYNFEAGITPFTHFPIAGAIWYQGESNAHNTELHEILFPALVKSWRSQWGYSFPFYYVQLSSINRPGWQHFRFSQLQMMRTIPNSGMAVSSDVGHPTDVHPRNKKPIGERLARIALHFNYGKKEVIPYGPLPLKAERKNKEVVVSFEYTGLHLRTGNEAALIGFKLMNEKGVQKEVPAFIRNNQVIIPVTANEKWQEVLYGWEPYTKANLVNAQGLPASTFKLKIN